MTSTPHDALVKATFSQVQYAADEFRTALPSAIVERLDLDQLQLCSGSFVDDELRAQYADLLYAVPLDGRQAFLYLLLEHQSTSDALMPFRLWRYMGQIWHRYLKDHPDATKLPVIIPLLLHHSDKGWTAATTIGELFDLADDTRQALSDYLPQLRCLLDDLSVQADEALRARSMAAMPKLVLWALKNARSNDDLVGALRSWLDVVEEILRAPNGVQALSLILRYILKVSDANPDELETLLANEVGNEAREAFMTGAEVLYNRRASELLRRVLVHQLEQRFGQLPDALEKRIQSTDIPELEQWTQRVITASSLDDVFAD